MRRKSQRRTFALGMALMVCLFVVGCTFNLAPPPMPTPKTVEDELTARYKTEVAPPPGFETGVQFPRVDANLDQQPGWHYKLSLSFDGVFTGTQDSTTGTLDADIYGNEQSGARRVVLAASGAAFGLTEDRRIEGVRIGNDYYQVDANKICTKVEKPGSGQIADLMAGNIIGGVRNASPAANKKTENGIDIWQYDIPAGELIPPALQVGEGGGVTIAAGELWVAPSLKAVWLYSITLNVDNAILQGDRPLTGQVRATYQLVETGVLYNISIPFGC
jgi:hypothetical protein